MWNKEAVERQAGILPELLQILFRDLLPVGRPPGIQQTAASFDGFVDRDTGCIAVDQRIGTGADMVIGAEGIDQRKQRKCDNREQDRHDKAEAFVL